MADWIDVGALTPALNTFFAENRSEISRFGNTVNQTFEAFVVAQMVAWFRARPEWTVEIINPENASARPEFRLKFSTRGRPGGYSYVRCTSTSGDVVQIRHQLRVATRHHRDSDRPAANVCLDVAVIKDVDLSEFGTNDFVDNASLITFGEAKHMSAFAELVANFIGLVHELQPERLKRVRLGSWRSRQKEYPSPFLFVSGHLFYTAQGIHNTITRRKFDLDVYTKSNLLEPALPLPIRPAPPKSRS